jgi:NADH:ubiquinone oxidoreductase subunit 6 (subunit J)
MIETVIFYIFAVATVISACAVVTVKNPVHAALFLVLTFFTSAVIWMSLEAESMLRDCVKASCVTCRSAWRWQLSCCY